MSDSNGLTGMVLPGWFVDRDWLADHLKTPGLRIVQAGGGGFYLQKHIPGAVFLNNQDILITLNNVPGLRAPVEQLERVFGGLGITPETPVVAYDESGGMDAGRLIWTLASMGHKSGAVLDGGIQGWIAGAKPVESGEVKVAPARFIARPDPRLEADWKRVEQAARGEVGALVVDTRSLREYLGLTIGRPHGHVAGAIHFDWTIALTSRFDPRLLPREELLKQLAAVGITDPRRETILYCQTAHRASHTWAMLRHLGFSEVRLYDGSMAEWGVLGLEVVSGSQPR